MSDIFLSYSRDDKATARLFAEGLEREGFRIWWDVILKSGEAYDRVTEQAVRDAKAVVVLWSKKSVESDWVRAEATIALRNKTLMPVMIEPCERPIMFELTHTADLSHWKGDPGDEAWRTYVADVRRFVQPSEPTQAVPQAVSRPNQSTQFGARSIAILVAVAIIAGGIVWAVTHTSGKTPILAAQSAQAASSSPDTPAVSARAGVSLAVLPFVDMSPEHNQEYFSDGLSEELLNSLAQIKELRVAGRTSSFSFKGKSEDLRVIGEKLGVSNILEGSVRKDGDHLRITAQLVNSKDGTYLWSQTFDRELKGVFAIQEEIAMAVSGALSITLDVGAMSRANGGTTAIGAYDKYLQAEALWNRGGGPADFAQSAQFYREALVLDPTFARAWYRLYRALEQTLIYGANPGATRKEMSEVSAKVVALAPDASWTQAMRMTQFVQQRNWSEADAAGRAALASAPTAENEVSYGVILEEIGRIKEGLEYIQRAVQAEPLSRTYSFGLQLSLAMAGRPDESEAEYQRGRGLAGRGGPADWVHLSELLSRKDADPAAVKAQLGVVATNLGAKYLWGITPANWDNKPAAIAALRHAAEDPANQGETIVADLADHYGEQDIAITALRRTLVDQHSARLLSLWSPYESGLRSDPRFKEIVRDLGLVDYWRASGNWGDFCKPVGKNDFECR